MKRRLLLLAAALLVSTVAEAGKPVFAVLPIKSEGDRGKLGKFVRASLNKKLADTYQYVTVYSQDVDDAMSGSGLRITSKTKPGQVAELAANVLQCRYVVWGSVTRATRGWVIHVRGMDLNNSKKKLTWQINRSVVGKRETALACGEIVAQLSGFRKQIGREPEVPLAKRRKDPRKNLLPNGDFGEGRDSPARWQRVENLTTFWGKDGNPGRCLLVDTDVLESQALTWRKAIEKGADFRKAPKKHPTRPPKYDTIGGTYGIHFISEPIRVKRGVVYRLTADVKGRMAGIFFPKLFIKGYASFDSTNFAAQDREVYRMYLACRTETQGREFENFTRTFLPNGHYVVFDIENRAGSPHAAKVAGLLRATMRKRNFPQIPLAEQMRRLARGASPVRFDTDMREIRLTFRDRLLCAHAIYGKVEKTDKGLQLCLRLASARIKRNIPLLDLACSVSDDQSLAAACDKFLAQCERRLPFVAYIRVIPYSYWPPGLFRWDNIVLTEEGDTVW